MIKRLNKLIFLLLILSVLLLMGCRDGKKTESRGEKKYVVGFSQTGTESEWRIQNTLEMQEAYENHPRFSLLYQDAQLKRENQVASIRNFIRQKVDAIIFVPIVTTGWDAVLTEARDAGIPVILINRAARMISGNIEDYTVCLIAPDNVYSGVVLAENFIEAFADEPGPVYVAEMTGTVGASSAIDRGKGIHTILDNNNHVIIRYSQTGDYNRSTARHVMESILKTSQSDGIKLRGVISHNDDMAIGAIEAIEEAGLQPGKDIIVAGIGGTSEAFEAMAAGLYKVSVDNPLCYGEKTIDILLELLDNGKKPGAYWVVLESAVYTEKDAAEILLHR